MKAKKQSYLKMSKIGLIKLKIKFILLKILCREAVLSGVVSTQQSISDQPRFWNNLLAAKLGIPKIKVCLLCKLQISQHDY